MDQFVWCLFGSHTLLSKLLQVKYVFLEHSSSYFCHTTDSYLDDEELMVRDYKREQAEKEAQEYMKYGEISYCCLW